MPQLDDVTLQTIEAIEESAGAVVDNSLADGNEPIVAREGVAPTQLDELGTYTGQQINSDVIFASEGYSRKRKLHRMNPAQKRAYEKKLAEVAGFYKEVVRGYIPVVRLQEAMMSSEFSALLGDTLDRILLAKYATYAPGYRQYLRGRTVRDFRAVGSVRRHTGGLLAEVAEGANYPVEGLSESDYSYSVSKYGKTYNMTWEMMINDDLDAFSSLPMDMADDAIQTEMYLASSLFVANTTLFSTTHAVTVDGTTTNYSNLDTAALAYAALVSAINTMVAYPGDENKPLNNSPVFLVVPPALEILANQILATQFLIQATGDHSSGVTTSVQPASSGIEGRLRVVVNPYIPIIDTTQGSTSWYLFSNPSAGHAAEYAFLRGYEQPQVFKRSPNQMQLGGGAVEENFDDDSIGYKVRHVFGGSHANATGGWRFAYWSKGTA